MSPNPFAIYEVPVSSGVLAICPMPVGHMDAVRRWSPDCVISMVEDHELPAHLWDGFPVHRVPVVDFDVPTGPEWGAIEQENIALLQNGGRVLIHCMGGCGRSGMAALRLMLVAGEPNALVRLRAVRACAVETEAQMAWATGNTRPPT